MKKIISALLVLTTLSQVHAAKLSNEDLKLKAQETLNVLFEKKIILVEGFNCVQKNVWDVLPKTRNTLTHKFVCKSTTRQVTVVVKTDLESSHVKSITFKKPINIDL